MRAISQNKPLLFIQGPPVFVRVDVIDEESTSIFVHKMHDAEDLETPKDLMTLAQDEQESRNKEEAELKQQKNPEQSKVDSEEEVKKTVDSSIAKTIAYLEGDFQKDVYRPLEFRTAKETYKGIIDYVEDDELHIKTEEETVLVKVSEIEEVYWRGKPFTEDD